MKYLVVFAMVLTLISGCARDSTRIMDQYEIDRIRDELGVQACLIRIDSIGFEIEGILYHKSIAGDSISLTNLLPDPMPVCPVSGLEYIIDETESEIIITCPSGHGSLIVKK